MPPKIQKCSICGTLETQKWFTLDRRSICFDCHDIQLNPPLEPVRERTPELPVTTAVPAASTTSVDPHCPMEVDGDINSAETISIAKEEATAVANADSYGPDEQTGEKGGLFSQDLQSPRRLRRRTCPTRTPIRRRVTKASRGNPNTKAKSRRTLLKKPPTRTPQETASTRSVQKLFHEDTWYQIGDIVSLLDTKDNTYYAQIRGLLVDTYNEKSAVLTWLIPTTASPPPNEGFDPATYQIGPDEDCPRRITYVKFVMHAPSSYYLDRNDPFPRPETYGPTNTTQRDNRNFVWASIAHLHYGDEK
ncbi:GATA zinc finger domain-containing protein 1 [Anopheles ziemanni]|uniref:GATA zinc finger domain-containing protein 1 n=1 Tax=Anopheles coustani TaxID=139045 RepID=UPI002658818C|nr:GATA zinc finger domain-containing protein 1 [Anopheles coustani]XP_058172636.1 GATA zinc finger domain-containing protein 1 [Anopheles ziemanni]